MSETLTIDFNKPIPLFALNHCALLPYATIALHVYEPRYVELTNDILDSSGFMALATYEKHTSLSSTSEYDGELKKWVCVGYTVRHEKVSEGRYNLLVQGICRAKIINEIESHPYRKAILRPANEAGVKIQDLENQIGNQRQQIEYLISDSTLQTLAPVSAIHNWVSDKIPTAVMIDLAILTLCSSMDQRYQMLAEPDLNRRADWLNEHLIQTRKTLKKADSLGPSVSDEGLNLN